MASTYGLQAPEARMRRFLIVLALLVIVPIVELTVLISVGHAIGAGWTILLVLATSALGAWLLRHQGLRSWEAVRADVRAGRPPGAHAIDGVLVLIGGVLMLIPGFVTDVIGLLFIAPPTRRLARSSVTAVLSRRMSPATTTTFFGPRTVRAKAGHAPTDPPPAAGPASSASGSASGEVIEGEIVDR
jgi:UPF0716 protein FxsA